MNESESHDVTRFMSVLNPDIEEKMKFFQTIQEAYKEAISVEHMLRQSRIQQCKPQQRRSQQRRRVHIVESHFSREDNPKLVVCQLLTKNEKEEHQWRQHTKFQTRVRCEGKLANLVIDRDSVINFVLGNISQNPEMKPTWHLQDLFLAIVQEFPLSIFLFNHSTIECFL